MDVLGWIQAGKTNNALPFNAPPGLTTGWTVSYSRNGGQETAASMSSPTVTEVSSSLLPGVYVLDIDEANVYNKANADAPIEAVVIHISATGWPGKSYIYFLYAGTGLPVDMVSVLGSAIAESAADNDRNIGY